MLIVIFGESCTGKSTLAEQVKERLGGEVCTGRDYLRMAKSEAEAKALFREKMARAIAGETLIWVMAEKEHLALVPDGAVRVLVTAELETIQARFAKRMGGQLPPPVAAMLENKHGCFDGEAHDLHVSSGQTDLGLVCGRIRAMVSAG